jgi:hypothetical protein
MDTSGPALALTFVEAGRSEPLTFVAEPLMVWAYSGAGLGRA